MHLKCTECSNLQKNWISELGKINGKLCTIYVKNVWISKENYYPEQRKTNKKLFTLYVRNIRIFRKIEYLELCKFNGKLCTLKVRNVRICRETEYPNLVKSTENCVYYMHGMSGFVEKLISRTMCNQRKIVYIICTECLDLQRNWISRTA